MLITDLWKHYDRLICQWIYNSGELSIPSDGRHWEKLFHKHWKGQRRKEKDFRVLMCLKQKDADGDYLVKTWEDIIGLIVNR